MYYENVIRKLQESKVRYAVAVGVALVLHGVVRFTADLDLLVGLEPDNLKRFIKVMNDLEYNPRNPVSADQLLDQMYRVRWKQEKNSEEICKEAGRPHDLADIQALENLEMPEKDKNEK